MGKPATTYWCGNGHMLEDNAHTEFGSYDTWNMDECPECPICKSTKVIMELEWNDPSCESMVPHKPIRHDEVEKTDCRGNKYYIKIPIYNVSKKLEKQS